MPNNTEDPRAARQRRRIEEQRRRYKRRILRNRIIFAVGCLLVLALLVLGVKTLAGLFTDHREPAAPASSVSEPAQSAPESQSAPPESAPESAPDSAPEEVPDSDGSAPARPTVAPPEDPDDWHLLLVNNNVPLPEDYRPETVLAEGITKQELQSEAAQAYIRMKDAASAQGVNLVLHSGYRSPEQQAQLQKKEQQKWLDKDLPEQEALKRARSAVAAPGCSEHNAGLAADIVTRQDEEPSLDFARTDAFEWLSEHAWEHGFILRYPENKQAITGMDYQPWHWRYVGPEYARTLHDSGLCLEEYLTGRS